MNNISNKQIKDLIKNEFNPSKMDVYIPEFEQHLANFFGVKNAIAVSSGTAAIHLALASLGISKGDEVMVPATAVIMSIIPILYQGATPIFVDCQKDNIDFDYEDLERKISNKVKAIIPVYLWGCSYDMDKLIQFAQKYNIKIIEDACQAHGSKWKNKYLGTIGEIGCFSMKNGKILATGEGGFILTNNDAISERCRLLRNHCIDINNTLNSFTEIGWNYRITEMQAYIGIINLNELDKKIEYRKKQTEYIYKHLKEIKEISIYKYNYNEDSNLFSPIFFVNKEKSGIEVAKKLSELRSTFNRF